MTFKHLYLKKVFKRRVKVCYGRMKFVMLLLASSNQLFRVRLCSLLIVHGSTNRLSPLKHRSSWLWWVDSFSCDIRQKFKHSVCLVRLMILHKNIRKNCSEMQAHVAAYINELFLACEICVGRFRPLSLNWSNFFRVVSRRSTSVLIKNRDRTI